MKDMTRQDEKMVFEDMTSLTGRNPKSIAGKDEETDKRFFDSTFYYFTRYESDRHPWEDLWDVADNMKKVAQSAALKALEEHKGANLSSGLALDQEPTRANLASTAFRRAVSQLTGQYMAVHLSRESPFSYSPIVNQEVPGSDVETVPESQVFNLYARWVMKRNHDGELTREVAQHMYTRGNAVEMCYWKPDKVGKHDTSFPKFEQLPLRNVWADVNHGDLETQHCAITCTPRTIKYMLSQIEAKEWDADQVKKLSRKHLWDGNKGQDKQQQRENEGLDETSTPFDTGFYLEWNVFMWAPIKDGKWKTGNIPELYWGTIIGNEPNEQHGILVKLEKSRDPDGEIPLHLTPFDVRDDGSLYSISPAQIIRSNYSAECTLKSQIVDEGTNDLLRPDIVNHSMFTNQEDFQYDGKPWLCDGDPRVAVHRVPAGNASPMAIQLLEWLEDDSGKALNLDRHTRGESQGARTSALEAANIYRSSSQPVLDQIRYSLTNRESWRAKKILSYSQYASDKQMISITDDKGAVLSIRLSGELERAFDIEIRIVDEYEDQMLKRQSINEAIGVIGQVPEFKARTNIEALLREFYDAHGLQSTKLVTPVLDWDSGTIADMENEGFLNGQYVSPVEWQNHAGHYPRHMAFIIKYQGIPDMATAIDLAKQHLEETKLLMDQQGQGGQQEAGPSQRNTSEGMAQGNQFAGLQAPPNFGGGY